MAAQQRVIELVQHAGVHRPKDRQTQADENDADDNLLDRRAAVHLLEQHQPDKQEADKQRHQRLPGDLLKHVVPARDP